MNAVAAEPLEDRYTLKEAARKLAFPSAHALRMYLSRRPGLVGRRYRNVGRDWQRLLTESEILRIRDMVSRPNPPTRKKAP